MNRRAWPIAESTNRRIIMRSVTLVSLVFNPITINWNLPTGSSTWLQSLTNISRNGSWIYLPKKRSRSSGVMNMPAKLLMTALKRAVAMLPPAAVVRITHMLTVVGKHVKMRRPSRRGAERRLGKKSARSRVKGSPTIIGHRPKVVKVTAPFNLWLEAACLSSESSRERPDNRNIHATPNFPMKRSACSVPPLFPI